MTVRSSTFQLAMSLLRYTVLVAFFLAYCDQARSQETNSFSILGTEYRIERPLVARSLVVRIASIDEDRISRLARNHYVPAGTPFGFLVPKVVRNRRRLAIDEHGILFFAQMDGSNYFNGSEPIFTERQAAIFREQVLLSTVEYGKITFTRSEIYEVHSVSSADNNVKILVGQDKLSSAGTEKVEIVVSAEYVSIVDNGRIDRLRSSKPILPFDASEELSGMAESLIADGFSSDVIDRAVRIAQEKLKPTKECITEVRAQLDMEGEVGAAVSKLLSPISGKISLSGRYVVSRTYPKGLELSSKRYRSGQLYFEILEQLSSEDCSAPFKGTVQIVDERGRKGRLDADTARYVGLGATRNGSPVYTCQREYFDLYRVLAEEYDLSERGAVLGLVWGARYDSRTGISNCESDTSSVIRSTIPAQNPS